MAVLLKGEKLMKWSGSSSKEVDAEQHLAGKVVGLYFSAHWCPPCRQFTPMLKDFYEEVGDEHFEVVWVTFDRSAVDQDEYLKEAHGAWCYILFGDAAIEKLSTKYGIQGIPALVIVKPNGDVITSQGVAQVKSPPGAPADLLEKWQKEIA